MQTYFIVEDDKPTKFQYMFNSVREKENVISITTSLENEKMKKVIKIASKIVKILKNNNIQNVVLSKKLYKSEDLKNVLYKNNIYIHDGRWMFTYLLQNIIEYIVKVKNIKKADTEVAIMANSATDIVIENIINIAKNFKRLNIVTNHIEYFKKLEKDLYDEFGIMITITNNKKKSLLKSNLILNMDFPQEIIQKFNINDNSIIVNIEGDIKITKKRFNGINIIDYELENNLVDNLKFDNIDKFYMRDIYETLIFKKSTYKNIIKEIKKLNITIKELIGIHGKVL